MSKGKLIVIEGVDGSGKTTQAKLLVKYLNNLGTSAEFTSEPTRGFYGSLCREILSGAKTVPVSELATLFVADRIDHNTNYIKPALEAGKIIVCDRYYYSNLAYQGVDVDQNWLMSMNANCPDIIRPDFCIFLDLDPEESMKRISENRESTEIYETKEYLTQVRNQFFNLFQNMLNDKICIVPANGTIEEVSKRILKNLL